MVDSNGGGGAYTVPPINDIQTPDEADAALRKLHAAWGADPQHPYVSPNHPQNKDFVAYANQLYRLKLRDQDARPRLEQAMAQGLALQEEKQQKLVERGQRAMEQLIEFRFTEAAIPDDLTEPEVWGLEMQLLSAQGRNDEVYRGVKDFLEHHPRAPAHLPSHLDLWREMPAEFQDRMLLAVLSDCVTEGRRKLGLGPRQKPQAATRDEDEGDLDRNE